MSQTPFQLQLFIFNERLLIHVITLTVSPFLSYYFFSQYLLFSLSQLPQNTRMNFNTVTMSCKLLFCNKK